jgi:hypothetical protein
MSKGFKNFRVVSDAFARPADTTAYTAGDSVAPAAKTITAASNASPIVITSATHGYATGDRVTIASVGGNTAANGNWVITRVDANSYSLDDSTGNDAYTSGGTSVRLLRLTSVLGSGQSRGRIVKTKLVCNHATITNGVFRVYYFSAQIAQIADNAAWTLLYANRATLIGHSAALTLVTEGSGSDAAIAQDVASEIPFVGSDHLYAVIVAEGAYTPTSGETFYLEVAIEEV